MELGVVPQAQLTIIFYCDNNGAVVQSKNSRNHKGVNNIEHKYHLIREKIRHRDVVVTKVVLADNLADPFTKGLASNVFSFIWIKWVLDVTLFGHECKWKFIGNYMPTCTMK